MDPVWSNFWRPGGLGCPLSQSQTPEPAIESIPEKETPSCITSSACDWLLRSPQPAPTAKTNSSATPVSVGSRNAAATNFAGGAAGEGGAAGVSPGAVSGSVEECDSGANFLVECQPFKGGRCKLILP